ncbi:MAG: hypothetical protein R3Y64_10020 [Peptostreptococcaceae bacterium]
MENSMRELYSERYGYKRYATIYDEMFYTLTWEELEIAKNMTFGKMNSVGEKKISDICLIDALKLIKSGKVIYFYFDEINFDDFAIKVAKDELEFRDARNESKQEVDLIQYGYSLMGEFFGIFKYKDKKIAYCSAWEQ